MQNRLDPVLETGHLRDKLRSFSHDATTRLSLFVRHPHFGQKSARMELRQHRRVDLIGLDLCPGDGPNQDRIGDDDPAYERQEHPNDRAGVAGRLDDNLVIELELPGEPQ